MKLLISYLIAVAIFLLGVLIINVLKKYGDDVVSGGVVGCCIIMLLTFFIYSFLK